MQYFNIQHLTVKKISFELLCESFLIHIDHNVLRVLFFSVFLVFFSVLLKMNEHILTSFHNCPDLNYTLSCQNWNTKDIQSSVFKHKLTKNRCLYEKFGFSFNELTYITPQKFGPPTSQNPGSATENLFSLDNCVSIHSAAKNKFCFLQVAK